MLPEQGDKVLNRHTIKDFVRMRYQTTGAGQQVRIALFDPKMISDAKAWLERRVGVLARFDVER